MIKMPCLRCPDVYFTPGGLFSPHPHHNRAILQDFHLREVLLGGWIFVACREKSKRSKDFSGKFQSAIINRVICMMQVVTE